MMRLDLKSQLIQDTIDVFLIVSSRRVCLPRTFIRTVNRSVLKDFKKGLREIDRKAGVFVELPKINAEGNGMYSETYDNEETDIPKEITVVDETALTTISSKKIERASQESP